MARKRKGRPVHGWLVLDKPADMTSTDALGKVRRMFGAAKAGHAGTLDPMATGVLPIAFGEATKTVPYAMDATKVYQFSVHWGEARDTDDAEGRVIETSPVRPEREAVEAALSTFVGEIEQVPPVYSAIKVDGERSYDLAREGVAVELTARRVRIDAMRLIAQPDPDHAVFEVQSGKGAYMRALARDLARTLGTVGHLSWLRRFCVGPFSLDDAVTLGHLRDRADEQELDRTLLPVDRPLVDIPAVILTEGEAHRVRCGQAVGLLRRSDRGRLQDLLDSAVPPDRLVLVREGEQPIALARLDGAELKPIRILNL